MNYGKAQIKIKGNTTWLNGRAPDSDSGGVGSIPAGAVVKAF